MIMKIEKQILNQKKNQQKALMKKKIIEKQ